MRIILKSAAILVSVFGLALSAVAPANAATAEIWKSTSSSPYKGFSQDPKVAVNGKVYAVAWVERTSNSKSKVDVKVKRNGRWSSVAQVFSSNDFYASFDVQVTDSGTVYLATSDNTSYLKVATNTVANTWVTTVADSTTSDLSDSEVAGSVLGNQVTFVTSHFVSQTSVAVKSFTFDEATVGAGWLAKDVKNFGVSDFSACSIDASYFASCAIRINAPTLKTADDGSQLLIFNGYRESNKDRSTNGMQFRTFKLHRDSLSSDWVDDGSTYAMTLGKNNNGYAFFVTDVAASGAGGYAFSLVTYKDGDAKELVHLFVGSTFASAPTAKDTKYLSSFETSGSASLVAFKGSFYVALGEYSSTRFGKVGSLAATAKKVPISSYEEVQKLLVVKGRITAVTDYPRSSISTLTLKNNSWVSKTKILSVAGMPGPFGGPAASDGTSLFVVAPAYSTPIYKILYGYTS